MLRLAAGICIITLLAVAAAWLPRGEPCSIYVGFAPGGLLDTAARTIAAHAGYTVRNVEPGRALADAQRSTCGAALMASIDAGAAAPIIVLGKAVPSLGALPGTTVPRPGDRAFVAVAGDFAKLALRRFATGSNLDLDPVAYRSSTQSIAAVLSGEVRFLITTASLDGTGVQVVATLPAVAEFALYGHPAPTLVRAVMESREVLIGIGIK